MSYSKIMEEAFEKMKKQGKNDVDNLVQWMKDSKVIDQTKEAEQKARQMFEESANKGNVELKKFKQVLEKIAVQQKKSVEDLSNSLAKESQAMLNKFMKGAEAFFKEIKK